MARKIATDDNTKNEKMEEIDETKVATKLTQPVKQAAATADTKPSKVESKPTYYENGHSFWSFLFLYMTTFCFFCANLSYYPQIRGLIGPEGLFPLRISEIEMLNASSKKYTVFSILAFLTPKYVNQVNAVEILVLVSIFVSLKMLITRKFGSGISFLFLCLAYDQVTITGRMFMRFQWDSLIKETGYLAALQVFFPPKYSKLPSYLIIMMACKLMFMSSVVKLYSECPFWWSLKALHIHWESQCLPTPLAWYAHNFTSVWFKKISVAMTFFIQLHVTMFFFGPKKCQKQAAKIHVLFQIIIALTGNYNWFNLNAIILLFPLFDDLIGEPIIWQKIRKLKLLGHNLGEKFVRFIEKFGILGLLVFDVKYFLENAWSRDEIKLTFNIDGFKSLNENFHFPYFVVWFLVTVLHELFFNECGHRVPDIQPVAPKKDSNKKPKQPTALQVFFKMFNPAKIYKMFTLIFKILFFYLLFIAQLETFCYRAQKMSNFVTAFTRKAFNIPFVNTYKTYNLASGYGLFARMTGGDKGREELEVKLSIQTQSTKDQEVKQEDVGNRLWDYAFFRYKPTMEENWQTWSFLHQPRLDWQMWFLALNYKKVEEEALPHMLCYRLLHNSKDVWALMEPSVNLKYDSDDMPTKCKLGAYHLRYTGPFNIMLAEDENNTDFDIAMDLHVAGSKMHNTEAVWYPKVINVQIMDQTYGDDSVENALKGSGMIDVKVPEPQTKSHVLVAGFLDRLIDRHRNSFLNEHAWGVNICAVLVMLIGYTLSSLEDFRKILEDGEEDKEKTE